ncbi:MAG: RdgB/HAM1 family non-canonical purine NTP pyrophosphatase [Bacteroidetes bacterium]|nr:RdgB/HAM1 family non-canonical purine NTP pyrophosphatase [Bacteroidota bacterium]MDA0888200.1 RdgB/HAM1 family non-canonical purine NTP pyrophosphatase [Bacteroidota bacterium]MDA1084322.1 RdgB/HAM1 family non-canonical purine NTP pyrophosphatase [Bacteroidota bacterium]
MKKLIFATHNQNKVQEVNAVFDNYSIQSLADLNYHQEIEETENTFVGNALLKARHVFEVFKTPVFSDDSGLEVAALDGAPGVYSACYAGEEKNHAKNNGKLLDALTNESNRVAQFKTVIAYKDATTEVTFEGIVKGCIAKQISGSGGFGYDPLFIPDGYNKTFGELPSVVKLRLSHRSRAIAMLHDYLKSIT